MKLQNICFSLCLGSSVLSWTVRRPTPSGPPERSHQQGFPLTTVTTLYGTEISKVLPLGTANVSESNYENLVVDIEKEDFVFRPRPFPFRLQFSWSVITPSGDTVFPRYPTSF